MSSRGGGGRQPPARTYTHTCDVSDVPGIIVSPVDVHRLADGSGAQEWRSGSSSASAVGLLLGSRLGAALAGLGGCHSLGSRLPLLLRW